LKYKAAEEAGSSEVSENRNNKVEDVAGKMPQIDSEKENAPGCKGIPDNVAMNVDGGAQENCCDVAVAQINYPNFKHNTQDSIEQARGRSHEKDSSQIFMLDDMQFGGVWTLFRLKQKKTENYKTKFNKIRKLSREETLVTSIHPPTEIRTDHGNETSIYILNIYLFLTLVS
jgi:hypothetical protein